MIRAPPLTQLASKAKTVTPTIPMQSMIVDGTFLLEAAPIGPTQATVGPLASTNFNGSKIGGLKLETPEKYTGSRVPKVSMWLLKMEWYFQLMNYPTNVWVDVVTTRVMDSA